MTRLAASLVVVVCLALSCSTSVRAPVPGIPELPRGAGVLARTARVDRSQLPEPDALTPWALSKPTRLQVGVNLQALYLHQGPAPLVSLRLVLPRGAASDPKGEDGLTALMADVLDEGAGTRTALELEADLQRLATDYSVTVATDEVIFKLDGLADTFAASVALLADIVRRPRFDAREFERKKDDLIAAALARKANPKSAGFAVLRRALFGSGYAGHISTGTTRSLKKLTLARVKRHYAAVVQPEGATFVVTGGVDRPSVERVLAEAFGDWRGHATAVARSVEEPGPKPGIHFVDFPKTSQSFIALGQRAEDQRTDVLFPAMIANRVLGGAFTSRLNLNLREDKGYTYGSHADFARYRSLGMYVVQASVKADTTRAAFEEIMREFRDICESRTITQKERDDAVNGLLLGFPGQFEQNDVVGDELADLVADGRGDDWFEEWPNRVHEVTREQAQRAMERYCNPERYVLVVAGDRASVATTLGDLKLPITEYDTEGYPLAK